MNLKLLKSNIDVPCSIFPFLKRSLLKSTSQMVLVYSCIMMFLGLKLQVILHLFPVNND